MYSLLEARVDGVKTDARQGRNCRSAWGNQIVGARSRGVDPL